MIDVNKIVDDYVIGEPRQPKIGRYYPSALGGCMRHRYLSYLYPQPLSSETARVFAMGNLVHDFIFSALKKSQDVKLIANEKPFLLIVGDATVSGRVDNIVEISGKKFIVEVKSTKSIDYTNEPSPSHLSQINFYMRSLEIPNGLMIYAEKNTLRIKAFEVEFNKEIFDKSLKFVAGLHQHLVSNTLPPAITEAKDMWACNYCDYRARCEAAGAAERKV